ncbi:LOW QUALITY PROTEIN: hypothetical protein HID58_042063, partial [Brassica napus]
MTPKTVAIRPVEFYGNGLPRPRFFDTPKFNSHRVDPPLSVLDPLLSWAREAHWSMGANKKPIESKSIVKDKKKKTESSSTRPSPRLAKRCS